MKINFKKLRSLFTPAEQYETTTPVQPDREELSRENNLIDEYMRESKPFLHNRYSIFQLSEETGVPLPILMAIIHRQRHMDFNEFVDSYRIGYCKQLLDHVPLHTLDIFDLTIICGFTDEKQFCAAFKKVTHIQVSKYIRRLCKEQH